MSLKRKMAIASLWLAEISAALALWWTFGWKTALAFYFCGVAGHYVYERTLLKRNVN